MSFDVFLQRFEAGQPAEANRESVQAVLRTKRYSGPNHRGYYTVDFPDGVHVELWAKGLNGIDSFSGCGFHIRAMSPHLVEFILDIAKAGDMVILPAMSDFVPILSSRQQRQQLPSDLLLGDQEPIYCDSGRELEALLTGGYTAWRRYRDQVSK